MGLDTKTYCLTDWLSVAMRLWLVRVRHFEASLSRELQRKGASQQGQEPLDTETEDPTLLEAATKQRSEDRDWEY
jgi:hypothetical protein